MYIILIHVTGIALLEILFYFNYIGPIESQLLKNSMKHITIHQLNGFSLHYNITKEINHTEFVENLRRENYQAEEKRKCTHIVFRKKHQLQFFSFCFRKQPHVVFLYKRFTIFLEALMTVKTI